MKNSKVKKAPTSNAKVKVLYQNLGGVWYAFAATDEDNVFVGRVPLQDSAPKKETASQKEAKSGRKSSKAA